VRDLFAVSTPCPVPQISLPCGKRPRNATAKRFKGGLLGQKGQKDASNVAQKPHRHGNRPNGRFAALPHGQALRLLRPRRINGVQLKENLMRKCVLLLAVAIAAAPSLASARVRHHAPPPPPVDQNAAGAHFVSEGLRNFLIVPIQSVFAPAPAPEPIYRHRHHKHV
jgi:hypothetical protein